MFQQKQKTSKYVKIACDFIHTYVRSHENLTTYYANILCQELETDPLKVTVAAYFHDHGKYGWDNELFVKPKPDVNDWGVIKKHPKVGVDVVLSLIPDKKDFLLKGTPSVADLIYLHHEKPNGLGYYGVKDLPIEAVIVSIADVFDACLSDRPYRKAIPRKQALDMALEPYWNFLDSHGYPVSVVRKTLEQSIIKITIPRKKYFEVKP